MRQQVNDRSPDLLARHLYRSDGAVSGELPVEVALPESEADVRAAVNAATAAGRAVVPRGAGTGLSGGAAPVGEATVVSLMRLDRILDVDDHSPALLAHPDVLVVGHGGRRRCSGWSRPEVRG